MPNLHELTAQQLYHACDPDALECDSSAELPDLQASLGQERAMGALHFGVGIHHEGYNLYVMGSPGLGKHAIVRQLLGQQAAQIEPPSDWCYINNFRTPHKPRVLRLPAGAGCGLQADMRALVRSLLAALPAAFDSDEYRNAMQGLKDRFKAREEELFGSVDSQARAAGIILLRTPAGFTLAPLKEGEVLDAEAFDKLPDEEKQQIEERTERIRHVLRQALQQAAAASRTHEQEVDQLNEAVTRATVERQFIDLEARHAQLAGVPAFLDEVKRDIIEKGLEIFGSAPAEKLLDRQRLTPFNRYFANVLVDNGGSQGAPLVYEDYPSYQNLIGRIEHQAQMGTLVTNFMLIKAGAFHRANGGYLVLDALKVLTQPYAWEALKRAMRSREIRTESLGQMLSLVSTVGLKPEPIAFDQKVVLVGDRMIYYLLQAYDPEFPELFKVAADFEEDIARTPESDLLYARVVATIARREKLRHADRGAVARLVEQGARAAGDGERLAVGMQELVDLLRESDHFAGEAGRAVVEAADVDRALEAREERQSRIRERLREQMQKGTLLIDTEGARAGQVNGLSVVQLGEFAFGMPSRITARVRLGGGGIVDIEREAELGGPLHSKGVMILSGFLAGRYATDRPLSLSATLVFEQNYGGVEGDSASCAELCALLSALAEAPLAQSIAITGSVNQHGDVQAIGGVNEKVEGFFDLCRARGLTGAQGVIIPASNARHLMLRRDVVQAVADGRFAVHPVSTVDEALAILAGAPAGERDALGRFPEESLNARVERRLAGFAERVRNFTAGPAGRKGWRRGGKPK